MYRGRFAPSPTGPLHLGSLLAATGSWLDARAQRGEWLLRIEDIDPPRETAGAIDQILHSLEAHGLTWDGATQYQSQRLPLYRESLEQLAILGFAYACQCSRSDIAAMGGVYDGRCRRQMHAAVKDVAWRFALPHSLDWTDELRGPQAMPGRDQLGDPVIWRRDGLVSYQLAVALDDARDGMSHVIRGVDLLHSTPVQIALQQVLRLPSPRYGHLPLLLGPRGEKLSKQNLAQPLDNSRPGAALSLILRLLGHSLPTELQDAAPTEQLDWAIAHWDRRRIPLSDHDLV